jgi:1-phosphofructokinase
MVITVTLNPAMDKTLTIENFNLGTVNRVQSVRYDIGGKGINVSKVLKNFGIDSICTGFLGGIWENSFNEDLTKRGITSQFIQINGNTWSGFSWRSSSRIPCRLYSLLPKEIC